MLGRHVFITEYVGLSTRLEALTLAFLIAERFGHEVCLDWHELDALSVRGARMRGRGVLGRIDNRKVHACPDALAFASLGSHRNLTLRTHIGPRDLLEPLYLPTARRVTLRADLADTVQAAFAPYAARPVVGVHIRRGDFAAATGEVFDVNANEWPAAPDWWYAHVMAQIRARHPDVVFFVSCTGSLDDFASLQRDFELFDLPTRFTYGYKGPDHASRRHPAADLFALACCPTIIGAPCSNFTHYAANLLGPPTTVLVPPATPMHRTTPAFARLDLHGRGAFDWYDACRRGTGQHAVDDATTLTLGRGARVDWMGR